MKKMTPLIVLAFLLGCFACSAAALGESGTSLQSGESGTSGEPLAVTDLYRTFKEDPQAVDAYGRSRIAVTGIVLRTGPDRHGTPSVELSAVPGGKAYALCVVNSYEQLDAIGIGETVTMSGVFHIFGSDDWVVLKQCEQL